MIDDPLSKEFQILKTANEKLQRENAALRRRLKEEREKCYSLYEESNHEILEVYKKDIRKIDPHSKVLAIHDELIQMRRVCEVYMNAMEELRTCYLELKNVYTDLETLIKEGTPAQSTGLSKVAINGKVKQ